MNVWESVFFYDPSTMTYVEKLRQKENGMATLLFSKTKTVDEAIAERAGPKPPAKLTPRREQAIYSDVALQEYREVAKQVGVSAADLLVEEFRAFLHKKDMPTYNLVEVVKYMDDIAEKDNPTKLGWHWCPVRAKDASIPMTWGRKSVQDGYRGQKIAASDFYESHQFQSLHRNSFQGGGGAFMGFPPQELGLMQSQQLAQQALSPVDWRQFPSPAYTRTIPLHALKKIAMIEKEFTAGPVVFLVTDYTVASHVVINPDPFLMAVIPNSAVAHGKGRFIIDVWDEPGFGLEQQLKPGA